jgi:hypothetical protein
MILDADEAVVVANAGWQEEHALVWQYDIATGRETRMRLTETSPSLRNGHDGRHLRVGERLDSSRHRFTVRPIARVDEVIASATHTREGWLFEGDPTAWDLVPRFAIVWDDDRDGSVLLHIDIDDPEPDPLDWYGPKTYDLGYQGLLDAYEVPGTSLLVICIQRDSAPVLYDPDARKVEGHLDLGGRGGNPRLNFRRHADEVWADDYDTLVRLRPQTWEIVGSTRLQGSDPLYHEFIGTFWFPQDERVCVVPRPFSGDVAFIDPHDFSIIDTVKTGSQPLEAVLLADGTLLARDWKSRALLKAKRRS